MNSLDYIVSTLYKHLGKEVLTPEGVMVLAEIYSNGNVACLPLNLKHISYFDNLREFHALSVKEIK
jgi:hypothetical protein